MLGVFMPTSSDRVLTCQSNRFQTRPPEWTAVTIGSALAAKLGLGDELERQDLDCPSRDELGLFRIALEKLALLQGTDGVLVGGSGEMVVVGTIPALHAAV